MQLSGVGIAILGQWIVTQSNFFLLKSLSEFFLIKEVLARRISLVLPVSSGWKKVATAVVSCN